MINAIKLIEFLEDRGSSFFTGVPDSQLQALCVELFSRFGTSNPKHIVAVNEGNAVALAAGFYLSTNKNPVVYLQNSGLGNAVNPATSLADPIVYGIPIIYIIGWRGEPGVHDEPQHLKQGSITLELLKVLGIDYFILDKDSTIEAIEKHFSGKFDDALKQGRSIALVVKKGAFSSTSKDFCSVQAQFTREEVIKKLADYMQQDDFVVSTTGKISRELYEHRKTIESPLKDHDFLTVGSMGHASGIALSIALQKPLKTIWCFDGDGAVLMHMGSLATIGNLSPQNFIHVVFNNASHESVGGMPTISQEFNLCEVASACKYRTVLRIETQNEMESFLLNDMKNVKKPAFIEILVRTGSRADLIRPETTPQKNKEVFMRALST